MTSRTLRRVAIATAAAVVLVGSIAAAGQADMKKPGQEAAQAVSDVVRTDNGLVKGATKDGIATFTKLPFAAAPVGVRRFAPPQPAAPWAGVLDATKPSPFCAQLDPEDPDALLPGSSEDCLYADVYAPAAASSRPRPVMVWIHGGGFVADNNSTYHGDWLAKAGDVVVVSINYRLGTMGLFGYPGMIDSGTETFQDQQAAFRWVQRNARAFGGDPHNLTIFGQSAGGMSTCAQLASPTAAGLFQRAIIESGSCHMNWPKGLQYPGAPQQDWYAPRSEIAAEGKKVGKELGCSDLACLRKLPAVKLLQQQGRFLHGGSGTPTLPLDPRKALKAGWFNRVPVIEGNTRDEQAFFGWLQEFDGPMTAAGYRAQLVNSFGSKAAATVEKQYPVANYRDPLQAWNTVGTDRAWICTALTDSRQLARRTPVWTYTFADRTAPSGVLGIFPPGYVADAYHGSEVQYLMDFNSDFNPAQAALSKSMIGYWTNFARTGNPNGPGLPHWPGFDGTTTQNLVTGTISQVNLSTAHNCDNFWAKFPQY
ncbi:carboxylesterase/lipase family protein [Kribbella sp. NPDC055071]